MYIFYFLFGPNDDHLHSFIDRGKFGGFEGGTLFYHPSESRWMVPGTVSPLED